MGSGFVSTAPRTEGRPLFQRPLDSSGHSKQTWRLQRRAEPYAQSLLYIYCRSLHLVHVLCTGNSFPPSFTFLSEDCWPQTALISCGDWWIGIALHTDHVGSFYRLRLVLDSVPETLAEAQISLFRHSLFYPFFSGSRPTSCSCDRQHSAASISTAALGLIFAVYKSGRIGRV
jgi:hypothetical protein